MAYRFKAKHKKHNNKRIEGKIQNETKLKNVQRKRQS